MKNAKENRNEETRFFSDSVVLTIALVIVTPALIYSLYSLNSLPYA